MSFAAWATPFFTTDQNGSVAWPCVTTASLMFEREPPPVLVCVPPLAQASRNAASPGTAATATPIEADRLNRSRRLTCLPIFSPCCLSCGDGCHQAPERLHTTTHVDDWTPARRRFRLQRDVLLEHVPAAVAGRVQAVAQAGEVHGAVAKRPEEAAPHGGAVGELAPPDPAGQGPVDVLQMHVADAATRRAGHLQRLGAADEQVAGVQAEAGAADLQEVEHLLRPLHERPHVGVERQLQTVPGGDLLGPAQPLGEPRPARGV